MKRIFKKFKYVELILQDKNTNLKNIKIKTDDVLDLFINDVSASYETVEKGLTKILYCKSFKLVIKKDKLTKEELGLLNNKLDILFLILKRNFEKPKCFNLDYDIEPTYENEKKVIIINYSKK